MERATITAIISSVLAILAIVSHLPAQEDPPRDRRERVLERIEMMRMWKMTEDLGLTEHDGTILFPFFKELDEERRGLDAERGRIIRELRATVRGEHPDRGAINDLLESLEGVSERQRRLEDREYQKVREVLDPEQVARYILFKQDFDREIRRIILGSRQDRPPAENPTGPGPVHGEDVPPAEPSPR